MGPSKSSNQGGGAGDRSIAHAAGWPQVEEPVRVWGTGLAQVGAEVKHKNEALGDSGG